MDLTPESLRSATFRDKLRGYHPDDVDEFLESVARGLEVLHARLRDATEKARVVAPPAAAPRSDEAVKTLELAQRTADLAIHEAKAEAERLVRAAEQKAKRTVSDAEDAAAELAEAAQAELRGDLERLQAAREHLVSEVQALGSWLEGERGRIRRALMEVADRLETVREAGDAPVPKPVSVPTPPRKKLEAARANPPSAPRVEPPRAPATPPVERPRASEPPRAPATPPVERARASTPPPAAPAPNPRATPPGGQPAVKPPPAVVAPERPTSPQVPKPSDVSVLNQAQQGLAERAAAPVERAPLVDDDDPFFAELRAAMRDQSPLGPREDDE